MSEKIFIYRDKDGAEVPCDVRDNLFVSCCYKDLEDFLKKNNEDNFQPILSVSFKEIFKNSKIYEEFQLLKKYRDESKKLFEELSNRITIDNVVEFQNSKIYKKAMKVK